MTSPRLTVLVGALLSSAVATAAVPEPWLRLTPARPEDGFIDDAYAVRADGRAVAYITTDGANKSLLHIFERDRPEVTGALEGADAARIEWIDSSTLLLLRRLEDGSERAQVYSARATPGAQLSATFAIDVTTVAGKPVVVCIDRKAGARGQLTVRTHQLPELKLVKRQSYATDKTDRIAHREGPFAPLWWSRGHLELVARKAGEYDAKADVRMPDRIARFDLVERRVVELQEIEDLMAFESAMAAHALHPGVRTFLHPSQDQRALNLIDALTVRPLTLARPLWMYELGSLGHQWVAEGKQLASLTVDPVNREAVARKKADPDEIDFYVVDVPTARATRVVTLAGGGRPSSWVWSGGTLAVLRKSRGFDRGGVALELYALPLP